MKHSDELQNTDQLWDILNKSSAKAKKCHKAQDVADFLKLIEIPRDGALGEYFSEVVEDLCTKKTDCFFRGLILLTPADQNTIVFELKRPTFQSEASITKAFSRMKGNPKYKRIVDLYMDESKKNSE